MKKPKYYREFLDKYGDVEVAFDSFGGGRFIYKGELEGVPIRAVTHHLAYLDIDTITVSNEKIKIRDVDPLEAVNDIEIAELYTLTNQGTGFLRDLSDDKKIKYEIIKVTYDDDTIFLKSEMVERGACSNEERDKWLQDCFDTLQNKLRIEIESGRGDKYKIATYKEQDEILPEALGKLAGID